MINKRSMARDEQGAAAIEMAFALPILLLFVYGIFQFGVILQANAGMQHALGEGARFATLYPKPADSAIETKMSDAVFGMNIGTFSNPAVVIPATTECTDCRDLQVTYTVTPNFLFFNAPPVTLTRSKRVYTVSPPPTPPNCSTPGSSPGGGNCTTTL